MRVKKIELYLACCIFIGCSIANGHAEPLGSGRPVVQKNFQQLIRTNRCPGCDLAGAVLTRINLSDADLSGANLAGAKLNLADLSGANLKGANLQGARLGGADLAGADLTGANLTGAVLQGAYLKGAKIDGQIKAATVEQGEVATGETVFVPDAASSKHAPYSQNVAIEKQQQAVEAGAVAAHPQDKVNDDRISKQPPVAPMSGSKHPVVMADAVVPPSGPVAESVETKPEKGAIILEEQNKHAVSEKTNPGAGNETIPKVTPASADAGVDKNSAVHDMIAQIEADTPGADAGKPPEKSGEKVIPKKASPPKAVSDDSEPTKAVAVGNESSGESRAEKTAATSGQQVEKQNINRQREADNSSDVAGPEETGTAATVKTTGAAVALPGTMPENKDKSLLYTVETPAVAAARKQALVEQLLDEDFCVECDLSGVDLSGKRLKGVDLERANLQGADLSDTNLSEANLKGANLKGANLKGADLSEADLYKADLSGADLTGADLSEASIDSADFTGAKGAPVQAQAK